MGKMATERPIWICDICLNKAHKGDPFEVTDILNQIESLVKHISYVTSIKSKENEAKIVTIMSGLAKTQTLSINEECEKLIGTKNDHNLVRNGSAEITFLTSESRNKVLLGVLMSFCNVKNSDLSSVSDKKIEGLSNAYESILNCRNNKVITLPALSKNLRLLKQTHNKGLLSSVSYPSGGKYWTVQNLANLKLPELQPPSQDFVSTDDNIQVF